MSYDYILILIIVILPLIANFLINKNVDTYKKINNTLNITGKEVAQKILAKYGLFNIEIILGSESLTDYYDSKKNIICLSKDVYDDTSIVSLAVAAHEVGHAIQHSNGYAPLKLRNKLVPIVNFSSKVSTILIFIGLFLGFLNLFDLGIILLLIGLSFHLITLPVEFNASKRAKEELINLNLISPNEIKGVNSILRSAAFTYIAGFIAMALQILRLIGMRNRD